MKKLHTRKAKCPPSLIAWRNGGGCKRSNIPLPQLRCDGGQKCASSWISCEIILIGVLSSVFIFLFLLQTSTFFIFAEDLNPTFKTFSESVPWLTVILFLLGKTNLTVQFSPAKVAYGENITVSVTGIWPENLSKGRYTLEVWLEDFTVPIYKTNNPFNCKDLAPENRHYFNHKKGDFVRIVVEFRIIFNGGSGRIPNWELPKEMFASGWYKVRGRAYNEYDEQFLCVDFSAYWVF